MTRIAGPYGHDLLGIDEATSGRYREAIREGYCGMKPGWYRVGFHYAMDDAEADYLIEAVDFVGRNGRLFLSLYRFDLNSGTWAHVHDPMACEDLSLEDAFRAGGEPMCWPLPVPVRKQLYRDSLKEAKARAGELRKSAPGRERKLPTEIAGLQFFTLPPEGE